MAILNSKKRTQFYILLYLSAALIAILGLAVNIKLIAMNDSIVRVTLALEKVKEENKILSLTILDQNSPEALEAHALSLTMSYPTQITLITHAQQ